MANVMMDTMINASAVAVWQTVSDFNGLPTYIEAISHSVLTGSGVGATRTLTLTDESIIIEKLENMHGETTRELRYSIVSSPLPLEDYNATMRVLELEENKCLLLWSSTFKPKGVSEEEAAKIIRGIYSMGFEGLKKLLEHH